MNTTKENEIDTASQAISNAIATSESLRPLVRLFETACIDLRDRFACNKADFSTLDLINDAKDCFMQLVYRAERLDANNSDRLFDDKEQTRRKIVINVCKAIMFSSYTNLDDDTVLDIAEKGADFLSSLKIMQNATPTNH